MCGRFTLKTPASLIAELFDVRIDPGLELRPRYNIAPTQPVAAVRTSPTAGDRELVLLRWGLIPSWAADMKIGASLINARSETVASKPAFRQAFRKRRCLIPADGFYEWQKQAAGAGGKKQPFCTTLRDGRPFALAGLWERWARPGETPGDVPLETCTILTTDANELQRSVHDRMPVILRPEDYAVWLDPQVQSPEQLTPLLQAYPAAEMQMRLVSTLVNNARNENLGEEDLRMEDNGG